MNDANSRDHDSILVVDDDAEILESLRDALEDAGYDVTTARHGREGLDRLASMSPPSLILLDMMMPVMSGPEFLDAIREDRRFSEVPVVVVSAYGHLADKTCGIADFIRKPVNLRALLACVARHCDGPHGAPTATAPC
jgi:CheY-like chemotaxis protein